MSLSAWLSWFKTLLVGIVLACTGHGGSGGNHGGGGGGASTPTYSVGGTVTGLAGAGLVLKNNGADALAVSQNGPFTFATKLKKGSAYAVTVGTQPGAPRQTCTVSQPTGTITGSNVTSVQVACATVPLTLIKSLPANGATSVAPDAPLALTFSAPLNAASVTPGSVTLTGPGGSVGIAIAVTGNTVSVTPATALATSAAYTLAASTDVKGSAGEALAASVKVTFQTAGKPWKSLIGRTLTFGPQNEGFECTTLDVTSDLYITGFRAVSGPAMQRVFVSLSVANSGAPLGDFDCYAASVGTRWLYAAGPGIDDVVFPAGFAVHVQAGQRLMLNLHMLNSDPTQSATDTPQILVQTAAPAEVSSPVEMLLMGNEHVNIPNGTHQFPGSWQPVYPQQVLGFVPLMRSHAIHQTVFVYEGDQVQTVFDADFDPLHQLYHPVSNVAFAVGDIAQTRCTFVNTTEVLVTFGDSSVNETCYTAVYLAPSYEQRTRYPLD